MVRRTVSILAALALAYVAPLADATTISIGASKDTTLFQNNVTNSSGAANGLTAGTNGNGSPRRSLIAFDVAGNIPAGAVIQSVQLNLVLGSVAGGAAGGGPANVSVDLHKLLANWGEGTSQLQTPPTDSLGGQGQGVAAAMGDATWNSNFHLISTWNTAGGDFSPSASASASIGNVVNSTSTWASTAQLLGDVQAWLDNPATNFGWALVNADEATSNTGRTFYSRDVATTAFHPQLEVTYQVVPEPTAVSMALLGAAVCVAAPSRARFRGRRR
jgi:hypothetical protein